MKTLILAEGVSTAAAAQAAVEPKATPSSPAAMWSPRSCRRT